MASIIRNILFGRTGVVLPIIVKCDFPHLDWSSKPSAKVSLQIWVKLRVCSSRNKILKCLNTAMLIDQVRNYLPKQKWFFDLQIRWVQFLRWTDFKKSGNLKVFGLELGSQEIFFFTFFLFDTHSGVWIHLFSKDSKGFLELRFFRQKISILFCHEIE